MVSLVKAMCLLVLLVFVGLTTTASQEATPTLSPEDDCALGSADCESCLSRGVKCLYCTSGNGSCVPYPTGSILPSKNVCALSQARWGVCWVNYEVLLITMASIAGVIIICLVLFCYCCCCSNSREKANKKLMKEEHKLEREQDERHQRHAERRKERSGRLDEIRKKYGLIKDDQGYERFDA